MIWVGGVPENAFVLLVEGIHRSPRKRHAPFEDQGVGRQRSEPPGRPPDLTLTGSCGEPLRVSEVRVLGDVALLEEGGFQNVTARKVGDGVAARLVQEYHVLAVGDPELTEADTHASA